MTTDTPDWDIIAEQEIESRRDDLAARFTAALDHFTRVLTWLERGNPGPLCIDGHAYSRRRAARKRRRR